MNCIPKQFNHQNLPPNPTDPIDQDHEVQHSSSQKRRVSDMSSSNDEAYLPMEVTSASPFGGEGSESCFHSTKKLRHCVSDISDERGAI